MDYEEAKIKAAREYAEGLFNPEDVANPEFSGSINCCAADFMEGAEWRRYNRKASDEEVEKAAKEYGRQNVVDPDDNLNVVIKIALVFQDGADWYDEFEYQSDLFWIYLRYGVFFAILMFLIFILKY